MALVDQLDQATAILNGWEIKRLQSSHTFMSKFQKVIWHAYGELC